MNQNKFQPDKKLFTICIYALITTVVAVFFIRCIWNWSETKSLLLGLLSSLSPFLLGFFIAYIMGNLSSKLENRFFTNTIHISNVIGKLGVTSRTQAIIMLLKNGLIKID